MLIAKYTVPMNNHDKMYCHRKY